MPLKCWWKDELLSPTRSAPKLAQNHVKTLGLLIGPFRCVFASVTAWNAWNSSGGWERPCFFALHFPLQRTYGD